MLFSLLLGGLFCALPAFASKVVEDSRGKFVFLDEVADASVHGCDDGASGSRFLPEGAHYDDDNEVPFRYYRIALPSKDVPQVSVSDEKLVSLGKPFCSGAPLKFPPVAASAPELKDGLWFTDVRVPLYVKNGSSVSLRKSFKLQVKFNGSASGVNPGKRAVGRALNPAGASRFGVNQSGLRKSLRKAAVNATKDVNFLAQFVVGDRNMATFSEDGLYAVDFKTIRNAMMMMQRHEELDGIPVEKICLYGASPDTLSDMTPGEAGRNPNHLFEIPIEVRDHSPYSSQPDGVFDDGDTLVFFGYGSSFWKRCDREDPEFENGKMDYFHSYSPYSFNQHFNFGWKGVGKGLRYTQPLKAASGSGKDVEWLRYVRAEKDAILRDTYYGKDLDWESSTGKEWFWLWHARTDTSYAYPATLNMPETEKLPGLVAGGRQYLAVTFFPHRSIWAGQAVNPGDQKSDLKISGYSYKERMSSIRFLFDSNKNQVNDYQATLLPGGNFRMDNPGLKEKDNQYTLVMLPNDQQFDRFDGYSVAYQWTPQVDSSEWLLPGAVSGVINVPVPSNAMVMKFVNYVPVGVLQATNGVAKDSVSLKDDVRYLAVKKNAYRSGLKVEAFAPAMDGLIRDIANPSSKLEYLIVTPAEFADAAINLAEFRSNGTAVSTIPTAVVAVEDIYRHYTGGRMSPVAIRNYLAYVKSVCPNFKYVLLAGSGHFDYRGFNSRLGKNYIPPFEKEDNVTEDFFMALDSGEVVRYGSYDLDVALGRLPVTSTLEFANYIQKAKDYEKLGSMDYSDWRSNLLLAADDAYNSGFVDGAGHSEYQERLASMIDSMTAQTGLRWRMKKVYLLDYQEDAAGQKKEAATDLLNIMGQGALFTTYYGHGSMTDWASEGLLKPSYLANLANKDRYTILGSFSCTVGRFDEGSKRSLSEEFLVADGVGSIASVGAARETFAKYNNDLAKAFMGNALFDNGVFIGDAFVKAKGNWTKNFNRERYNSEQYVLLGEPVIQMPRSDLKVSLDQKLDTLKALDKMTLSGTVKGMTDGHVNLVLTEGRSSKPMNLVSVDRDIDVFYEGSLIYSEEIPVKDGRFKTEFVTPRKISFGDTAAEFSAWAFSTKNASVGRLWQKGLVVSGVSSYADSLKDKEPPTIQIQSCYGAGVATSLSEDEHIRLQSPACLQVVVEDSTALDFREQADEGISFEVAGIQEPFHPWPYIEQTTKRAKVRMQFSTDAYPAGRYLFRVRASDVLGNASIKSVYVEITDDMEAGITDVFNAPNPMGKKGTTFYFKNLAVDRASKVNIFIYNQNGRLVKVLKDAVSGETTWNGRDEHGRPLANGLYHYVVKMEVPAVENFGKKTFSKKQKLLISR